MNRKAFTLVELAIAMAISAIMLTGLYAMISSVVNAKESLESATDELYQFQALQRLIARDIRLMSSAAAQFPMPESGEEYMMTLTTQNSLTFNKALPVGIAYIYDNETIYREERVNTMNYRMRMPLVPNVTEWKIESFDGSVYREGFRNNALIFRFTFTINNRQMEFITGRLLDISS